ncbi:MAG: hypothetical protein AAFS13_08305, partial [Pseudomonadota bacterium]
MCRSVPTRSRSSLAVRLRIKSAWLQGRRRLQEFLHILVEDVRSATSRNYSFIRDQQIIANDGGPSSLDQYVEELLQTTPPLQPGAFDPEA